MKTQREKFDDWYRVYDPHYETTYSGDIETAFDAWQAAIESVVVNLSAIDGVTDDSGRTSFDVVCRGDVEQALDKAGVKYE